MSASHPLLYPSQARAAAALMNAVAHGDECVSLLCEPGLSTAAVLDEAENKLSGHGLRCVRVYGPASGGLTLRDLVGQIVARADPDALTDADLKAGFATLTEPGEGHDRVALLVTEAQNLLPAAMRYIQLACRSSPKLRVALAGQPGLAGALASDEFAYLRRRITRTLKLPGPMLGKAPGPWSVLAGLCRGGAGPLVRLGLAAASVLLIAAAGWHLGPVPSEAAMQADDPASGGRAVLVRAAPEMPADPPSPAEPAAAQQTGGAATERQAEASLPEPGSANASAPGMADVPAEQGPALPGPLVKPVENGAGDALPVSILPPGAMEPAPDAATPLPASTAVSAPTPSPQPRSNPTVALPPLDPPPAQRPRGGTERTVAALPTRSPDERRCRDIVLHAQLGKDLSNADHSFLRDGCRAK